MSKPEKSHRNKTIDFSLSTGQKYFNRCLQSDSDFSTINNIINKTINGDSFQIIPKLPQNFVDLLIADPPYNLSKNYNGYQFKKTDDANYAEYTERWLKLIIPLLKDHASVYICCDWKTSIIISQILPKYLHVRNRITWQREKGRGAKENWKNGLEDIWFATKSDQWTFNLDAVKIRKQVIAPYRQDGIPKDWQTTINGNFRDTCPSTFWDDCTIPYWSMPENTAHPTQKPEKLLAKMILASSNPKDLVFDPFLGSGTTSVTAKKLHRHYLGIEINQTYCAWAEKRLEMADNDNSIQGYTDGVFWERNTLNLQKKHMKASNGQLSLRTI